jgi:hypothetical protein
LHNLWFWCRLFLYNNRRFGCRFRSRLRYWFRVRNCNRRFFCHNRRLYLYDRRLWNWLRRRFWFYHRRLSDGFWLWRKR